MGEAGDLDIIIGVQFQYLIAEALWRVSFAFVDEILWRFANIGIEMPSKAGFKTWLVVRPSPRRLRRRSSRALVQRGRFSLTFIQTSEYRTWYRTIATQHIHRIVIIAAFPEVGFTLRANIGIGLDRIGIAHRKHFR